MNIPEDIGCREGDGYIDAKWPKIVSLMCCGDGSKVKSIICSA